MERLVVSSLKFEEIEKLLCLKERRIFNFVNSHDLYQFVNQPLFRKAILRKENINLIDGFVLSLWASISNFRIVRRLKGPRFTKEFFENKGAGKYKHLFIGFEKQDIDKILKRFDYLNKNKIRYYNPPHITEVQFSKTEVDKIAEMINNFGANCVWVGIGCPKQNIHSEDLFGKTKAKFFFNVGAAMDFLIQKKKEAPKLISKLGIEWLYRLITDFHYSKKKVWRSFVSIGYLNQVRLK
ncbi:MAG: WecB/TagA/CpsF family glycosyltransferase [Nanoarchaeota archaeon]